MAFQLYETQNPIDREQRRRINLNWTMISDRFSNMQGQISVLAGGEDVEALIVRINDGINGAAKAKEDADKATEDARTAIDDVNTSKAETEAATVAANEATTKANEASATVQAQINELNEKLPQLTQQLEDGNNLKAELEGLQTELTTLQTDLNTAKENTEKATADAVEAYNAIKGWGAATVWSSAIPYEKNNVVTHNGSSWQAVNSNVNSEPTVNNPNWLILARAGLDGLGSVITVNNQSPDTDGNVQLTKANIGLGNVEDYFIATTDEAIEGTTDEAYMTPLKTKESIKKELEFINKEPSKKEVTLNVGENSLTSEINSPVNVLRIDGKTIVNLPPLFDSGAWSKGGSGTVTVNPNEISITESSTGYTEYVVNINVKPNTTYTLSFESEGETKTYIQERDSAPSIINTLTDVKTFTTKPATVSINIILRRLGAGTTKYRNVSLVEGSEPKPFVANVKGLTNPTIVNEANGTSLVVPTTLYDGEYVEQNEKGELVKYKKFAEFTLDDSLTYEHFMARTGFKEIRVTNVLQGAKLPTLQVPYQPQKVVKYNGQVLINADTYSNTGVTLSGRSDVTYFDHLSRPNTMLFTISNTDSGWGDNYAPTPEEIKAYFLGWKMRTDNQDATLPYNGTGTKAWGTVTSKGYEGYTTTIPTVQVTLSGAWQPYRLIYELATPVQEVIQPYSDLTLEKGENSVKVYAGRIVNERYNYILNKSGDLYVMQTGVITDAYYQQYTSKYYSDTLRGLYGNGKPIQSAEMRVFGVISENSRGIIVPKQVFDPTASYTVDYEPLYTWEVTAPIDSVQLQYFETLQAVTNELVHDVAKQQDTVKRMLENVVNEDEGVVYIKPTLLNGLKFVGDYLNSYYKTSDGTVHIHLFLEGELPANGVICQIPKGYRPKASLNFTTMHYDTSTTSSVGGSAISPNGTLQLINSYAYGKPYHIINLSYKAEQ